MEFSGDIFFIVNKINDIFFRNCFLIIKNLPLKLKTIKGVIMDIAFFAPVIFMSFMLKWFAKKKK